MTSRLLPLFDRVLIRKIIPQSRSAGGILLPDSANSSKINTGVIVAVGQGNRNRDSAGNMTFTPLVVKEGDRVVLPEYGGTTVKFDAEELHLFREGDLLGVLKDK